MSFGFCGFCSITEDNSNTLSLINKNSKIPIGKDRIYKLHKNETLNNFTKSFYRSESLDFSSRQKTQEKYNIDNSIFEIKMPYICIFCGGESCKWENPHLRKNSAIHGLLADLYFDCVYASQRPSTCLIKQYNLLEVFKRKKIKLIINCQINGEHPYCGPNKGLEEDCGFSYNPSAFISEGIEVLLKGFKDLTPPDTLDFILEIVRKMAYVVKYKKGRILVHCHAGNGRTGIVLVCFFMYYFNKSYNEALTELRKLRKKGVEKISQEIFCQKFEEYLHEIKNFFPNKRKKIHFFIQNQKILDFNFDKSFIPSIAISYYLKDINLNNNDIYTKIIDMDFVPKILFECIEKIIEIKTFNNMPLKELYLILNGMNEIKEDSLNIIKKIKSELKVNNWDSFKFQNNISILSELLFIWMNNCVFYIIDPKKIEKIIEQLLNIFFPNIKRKNLPQLNISNDNLDYIDENLLNGIKKLFDTYIDNKEKNINEIFNKMIHTIKSILSKLEYETIKYISIFLQMIYPTNKLNSDWADINQNNDKGSNIYEYKRFLYKFCLFLLGYNLDKVNLTPNKFLKSKELLHSRMLIFIFELFIFCYNKNDKYVNKISNNEEEIIDENEDIFFKYKNSIDFNSIKNFL